MSSSSFAEMVALRNESGLIRLQARAKEASLLFQLAKHLPELQTRLDQLSTELHKQPVTTHDPCDLAPILHSQSLGEFSLLCARIFPQRFYLQDLLPKRPVVVGGKRDTRHQDRKDVERDSVQIQNQDVLQGSAVGYEGLVARIAQEFASAAGVGQIPNRFARAVLHVANRTTSGGDAFEALQTHVANPELVFIAPVGSDPIRLTCAMGAFQHSETGRFDFGLVAKTESCCWFACFGTEDVDRNHPLARFKITVVRELGLGLPCFGNQVDDGKSAQAAAEYACDRSGGYLDMYCEAVQSSPFGRNVGELFE
ncbi:hypothetical protein BASA81_007827 [Batrachochytrium salamandrivorans]|nr:hypothetical protein BASA81_007827 [Batrachochytrium salamandrivorans]